MNAKLPHWPAGAVAVLATTDAGAYAIPVSSPVRADDRRILIALQRQHGSLARLRRRPEVALLLLTEGNIAFTARGHAEVVAEHLTLEPDFAGVAIEVDEIDDHRSHAFAIERGIDREWLDDNAHRGLNACVEELREIAGRTHTTAGGLTMASTSTEPVSGNLGAPILGPRNEPIEQMNPDALLAPVTDAGTVPNLKYPFALAHNRVLTGGWAREVTTRELPVSKEIAGVNMRIKPGGYRELHWHKEAEWGFVIAGSCRVTLLDEEGRLFADDTGVGDLWYFPAGLPHSIQALDEGVEFLLVFDSGDFSENETFLISDWFGHTPRDVLAKNFGVDESEFDDLPTDVGHTRYIFDGDVPPSLGDDAPPPPVVQPPLSYTWHMLAQEPIRAAGGRVRITDSRNFTVSKTVAAAYVEVEPGGIRELHWHPTTDEWQYYLGGKGRMTVFASGGKARTFDYQAGDVGYVPFAMGHYVENTGDEPLVFLEMFRSDHYADVSLSQWMGTLPPAMVKAHLNVRDTFIAALPKSKPIIGR